MMLIYNIGVILMGFAFKLASIFNPKASLWVKGRKNWRSRLKGAIDTQKPVVWIHAASLGEFEQGRPVIEEIREKYPDYFLLLTFFSPSGYELRKDYKGVDYVCYLPLDTPLNARAFARIVKPKIAIFVKYEFWINLLTVAHRQGCRLYVISAIFRKDSAFFKFYGGIFRRLLLKFSRIFVQNQLSCELLEGVKVKNVTLAGDTRFDRVQKIAKANTSLPLIESFVAGKRVFVAGSTWPDDEKLLVELINNNPEVKFIIAPHEIDHKRIEMLREQINSASCLYTNCCQGDDLSVYMVMFVDTIGILSKVYGYGNWAYVGGGFGVGIHNTLEAATFGLPLAFGPNYSKFAEARDMVALQVACSVEAYDQLSAWFRALDVDGDSYAQTRQGLRDYVNSNLGATRVIIDEIFSKNH